MEKQLIVNYDVQVERRSVGTLDRITYGDYWWDVTTLINGNSNYCYHGYGWAKTADKAKKKALYYIWNTERKLAKEKPFGIVFALEGSARMLEDVLA